MKMDMLNIVNFAINGVEKFLSENPDLTFYAFAFACDLEGAEINLCLNTEEAFSETLAFYQSGKYANSIKQKNGSKI